MMGSSRKTQFVVICLVAMVTILDITTGQNLNHTRDLFKELFSTRHYNKHVRPVDNQSDCLEIYARFGILSVTKLDVRDGRLIASGASSRTWVDPQLSWNASDYGNLTTLPIPPSYIWLPGIVQYSSDIATSDDSVSVVWLYNNGQVVWMTAGNHETTCDTNIFAFPFDTHDCTFNFMTASHPIDEILLVPTSHYVELYNTWTNQEWKYNDHGCYSDSVFGLSRMRCSIHLQRRPQFVIYHLLMPLFCLIVVTIFVFWVPITSGERLGFSVTLFLAYNVQLAALLEELPRNSIQTPFYSRALVGMNIISALCVVFSVIVNRISLKSKAEVPESLKFIVQRCTRKKRRARKKRCTSKVTPVKCIANPGSGESTEGAEIDGMADNADDCLKMFGSTEDEVTWLEVAEVVDYFLFVLILLAVGTGVCAALVIVFWYTE